MHIASIDSVGLTNILGQHSGVAERWSRNFMDSKLSVNFLLDEARQLLFGIDTAISCEQGDNAEWLAMKANWNSIGLTLSRRVRSLELRVVFGTGSLSNVRTYRKLSEILICLLARAQTLELNGISIPRGENPHWIFGL